MARNWIFAAITGTWLLSAGTTYACGTGAEFAQPPPKPVVQNDASTLLTRATELDSAAAGRERNALTFDTEADRLVNRARLLRNQAQLVNVADRDSIVDIADELLERSSELRTQAATSRAQAADFRQQARTLRDRAAQLARNTQGGGGWRGPRRATSSSVSL